jgi:hypothetical protein
MSTETETEIETACAAREIVRKRFDEVKAIDPSVLFVIAKSGNRNTVVYAPDKDSIVRPYWIMFEKPANPDNSIPTEDLNFVENNLAYGISCAPVDAATNRVKVVGYPKMNFQVRDKTCTVEIDGAFHRHTGIYVHQTPNPGYFSNGVDGVSVVYGQNAASGCRYIRN